jgi:catechol 2,3-dioxygenase-like lactoylglutathione lyase family enzyme
VTITIDRLDHMVIYAGELERTLDFYSRVLGMRVERKVNRPSSLHFGAQKSNVHTAGREFSPRATRAMAGSADFCLIAATPIEQVVEHLKACGVTIELGPVDRDGATGTIRSVYFRDPDDSLVEVSNYVA